MAGGSVQGISIDGRNFAATADSDVGRMLGGFSNEVEANGDQTSRLIKTAMPWQLGSVVLNCDDSRGDHEFIQNISDGFDFVPITITTVNNDVYQGSGQIVGDLTNQSHSTTLTFDIKGTGKLTKQ